MTDGEKRRAVLAWLIDTDRVPEPDGFHVSGDPYGCAGYTPDRWVLVTESTRGFGKWWATFDTADAMFSHLLTDDSEHEPVTSYDLRTATEREVRIDRVARFDAMEPENLAIDADDLQAAYDALVGA